MIEIGSFALCFAWILALLGVTLGSFVGFKSRQSFKPEAVEALTRLTKAIFWLNAVAMIGLGYGFVTNDYSVQYVWQYSNREMPDIYKITAIWGGMDGSMLLWCFILSGFGFFFASATRKFPRALRAFSHVFFNSTQLFFLTITLLITNPFRFIRAPFIPPDGNGLNPLLQNEYMAIHPPMLYLGFTGLAIPYAVCMAALASGYLSNDWVKLVRRWSLVAWTFLTIGIVLGGHWAYLELGWGGFWAWDPVENASFLPWLSATAFLHSIMVQERKGMLKVWNVSLITLSYGLTVFGTFLTRSGVVQSVHSFASTDVGWVFLLYLGLLTLVALVLVYLRWSDLKSERQIESILSRESAFLVNNLLLLSICFAIFWGVMFPVFSEWITGKKQTVGIPFFNAVTVPLFLLLIFVMALGPLISWRRAKLLSVAKVFAKPFAFALACAGVSIWSGISDAYAIISYSLCVFLVLSIATEFSRGITAQKGSERVAGQLGIISLFRKHRIRYGGQVIHLAVAIMAFSITASMVHKTELEFALEPGKSIDVGRFSIRLDEFHDVKTKNYEGVSARTTVLSRSTGEIDSVLNPELRFYPRNKETTTEVALRMGTREDLYLVLAGLDDSGTKASLKLFINPFQIWLWVGALVMVLGAIIVIIPEKRLRGAT